MKPKYRKPVNLRVCKCGIAKRPNEMKLTPTGRISNKCKLCKGKK